MNVNVSADAADKAKVESESRLYGWRIDQIRRHCDVIEQGKVLFSGPFKREWPLYAHLDLDGSADALEATAKRLREIAAEVRASKP